MFIFLIIILTFFIINVYSINADIYLKYCIPKKINDKNGLSEPYSYRFIGMLNNKYENEYYNNINICSKDLGELCCTKQGIFCWKINFNDNGFVNYCELQYSNKTINCDVQDFKQTSSNVCQILNRTYEFF